MSKGSIDVIIEDLGNHPCCPHGPTVLFSRQVKGSKRNFFACSACRDRKQCNFFLWEDEREKFNTTKWTSQIQSFIKNVNHRKMFLKFNVIYANSNISKRCFCNTCNMLYMNDLKHDTHSVITQLTDFQLEHPSEFLPTLVNSKKEAQYHFSLSTVQTIIDMFTKLQYSSVICIGTPRIHEYLKSQSKNLTSILLDIDKRFHNFFGPLEYCWYNMFNNHFFSKQAKQVFRTFMQTNGGQGMVLITDPPFGGRTELLSSTLNEINTEYKKMNNIETDLPMFWIYPYFMEPQIGNSMSNFSMLDYKVDYENHKDFQNSLKGSKKGSPVRLFTNVKPSLIRFRSPEYKFCAICERSVSIENRHCNLCKACTSKNGESYVHCNLCCRCVKPSWKHCQTCNRCAQIKHTCGSIEFMKECFNCKKVGHKKIDCPLLISKPVVKRKSLQKLPQKRKRKNN